MPAMTSFLTSNQARSQRAVRRLVPALLLCSCLWAGCSQQADSSGNITSGTGQASPNGSASAAGTTGPLSTGGNAITGNTVPANVTRIPTH